MNIDSKKVEDQINREKIKIILKLFNLNKLIEAKKEVEKQLITNPNSFVLFNILGAVLAAQNQLEKALISYKQSIKINPNFFQAHNNLGVCLFRLDKIEEAILSYQKSLEIQPEQADANNNLGIAFGELGNYDKSLEFFKKAIKINSNHADAHNSIGTEFKRLKDYKKAVNHYREAIKINPNFVEAYSNLGNVYKVLNEYDNAISYNKKAIKINSRYAEGYFNLASIFDELNETQKSTENYLKAIEIQPNHINSYNNILFNMCWATNNKEYLEIAKKKYNFLPKYSEKKLTNIHTSTEKKLNIGFVSGDLRNHSVLFFILDTLKYLKNENLKLFAYCNNEIKDDFTKLIKEHFYKWVLIIYKKDIELINLIRKDNIDILIDLSGHTANNRLAIFKNRCAPVQATWCGWLASTGIKEIDYIIGDKHATLKSDQKRFSEKIFQLKNIWQCSSLSNPNLKKAKVEVSTEKNVVLGSFSNPLKINDSIIKVWSQILRESSNTRLFLKNFSFSIPEVKKKIIEKFDYNKVDINQLIIEGQSKRSSYFECYNRIDIVLDTFPANGGATSFDASYMGVPVLTKSNNQSHWFRSGESINKNLAMEEWIAKDEEDYVTKALNFSEDKNKLVNLKKQLISSARKSTLFDSKKFSSDFYEMLLRIKK